MRKGRWEKESVTRYTEYVEVGKTCTHGPELMETFLDIKRR